MNLGIDFNQLAQWQSSAQKNGALLRVLQESAGEVFGARMMPLAMAFHEASVGSVYQHFGFSVFSPESRRLLAIAQCRQTRTSHWELLEWLDHAAYQQLADFHVLRYLDTEPDWLDLDHAFCTAVVQRLMVTRRPEWDSVGLSHYPSDILNKIMFVIDDQMDMLRRQSADQSSTERLYRELVEGNDDDEILRPSVELWGTVIDEVLARACQEPLRLLSWRLEALTTEQQLSNDGRLAVQTMSSAEIENKAFKLVFMILILSGFDFGQDAPVVSETPVSQNALIKGLSEFLKSATQASRLVSTLIGAESRNDAIKSFVSSEIDAGVQLGLFRWTPMANHKKGLLLSSMALQIINPYRELLDSVFRKA